ncbi:MULTISPECIES: threonine ammonia-lyase [Sphingobium]|jgi:threonine dehydratase|uniref:Threonine/serine dehydratase n=1 Tax=Sphingobium limneticum TaxID=1007511 RepID=A0A5J5HXL5_9SPHN|nr:MULTISPECIES: threonine/serine dehydratase [Sphingobium]MBU0930409.1 threonine/serine dehydratase [Alphaproteobacteria bacterium]KAA9012878.1 threonine/serine dehydratase [Sphingobium limneticum]KAA9013475.1 threonine/serine dehydratase [Sphingobium limneticum]KAA9026537.1 threonine/serine dehydratase [Sphingobium limneticum]BBD02353.1 threonine dehydratase [Sphingobium sp. YG1]
MTDLAIDAADVRDAAERISGAIIRTPMLEFAPLNERVGHRVLVKFEGAQHTGSFKFRGAYNRLSRIPDEQRAHGVVAWSSGNHAQGVAAAARLLDIPATIVMPSDAPAIKVANTRALGAQVVPYDRYTQSREAIATALAAERDAVLVPSFDDPYIIAGQGTAGLEIWEQAQAAGVQIGRVLVCCGGGGLVAGIATAIKDQAPGVAIYSVEPAAFDDTARSLASGVRESVEAQARSICDALLAPSPGALTFPINKALLSGGLCVTDDQVRDAMRFAFEKMKLVIEPGGAVALAAALEGIAPPADGATVVVISGSNVDPQAYAQIIAG